MIVYYNGQFHNMNNCQGKIKCLVVNYKLLYFPQYLYEAVYNCVSL